jgi:hypothetical protein
MVSTQIEVGLNSEAATICKILRATVQKMFKCCNFFLEN